MSSLYIVIKQSQTSQLRVCRACLATDVRLYDMQQNRLMEAYCSLLNTAIQVTDDLPQLLCSYCALLLLKCHTFRTNCIDTLILVRHAQLQNIQLTLEQVKQINRPAHFRQSYIQTIDIDDETNTKPNEIFDMDCTNVTEHPNEDVKVERDLDTDIFHGIEDHFESYTVANMETDYLDTSETAIVCQTSDFEVLKEEIKSESSSEDDNEFKVSSNDNQLSDRSNYSDLEFNSISSIDQLSHGTKFKEDIDIEENDLERSESCNMRLAKQTADNENTKENGNNDTLEDLKINFDSDLVSIFMNTDCNNDRNLGKISNIDAIELSKEEQMKEIEDEKKTDNLQALFKCPICKRGFVIEEAFKKHMTVHDNLSVKEVCDVCQCRFIINDQHVQKRKQRHKKRTCLECGSATHYIKAKAKRYKNKRAKIKCTDCGKEFKALTSHCTHVRRAHPTSDQLVRCELCGDSFVGQLGLNRHEKRSHVGMKLLKCRCSVCNTQFYSSKAIKAHRGTDGVCDTTHKYCVRCGESFDTEELLKEHEMEQQKPRTFITYKLIS